MRTHPRNVLIVIMVERMAERMATIFCVCPRDSADRYPKISTGILLLNTITMLTCQDGIPEQPSCRTREHELPEGKDENTQADRQAAAELV